MTRGLALGALAMFVLGATQAMAEVESGLAEGSSAGAFNVRDVTGPNAGRSLCYR